MDIEPEELLPAVEKHLRAVGYLWRLASPPLRAVLGKIGWYKGEARARATKNVVSFSQAFARVDAARQAAIGRPAAEPPEENLSDPAVHALLEHSFARAMTTSSEEHHSLLARLVLERLSAGPTGLVSAVAESASRAIPSLLPSHLHLMALLARMECVPKPDLPESTGPNEYDQAILRFWEPLEKLWRGVGTYRISDIQHLLGQGLVVAYDYGGKAEDRLEIPLLGASERITLNATSLSELDWWKDFQEACHFLLTDITLTSTGRVVGTIAHDVILGTHTEIGWE